MDKLQDLVDLYFKLPEDTDMLELAKLEQKIWLLVPKDVKARNIRRVWLKDNLNISHHSSESRQKILNSGSVGEFLWEKIRKKEITLSKADKILLEIKHKKETPKPETPSEPEIPLRSGKTGRDFWLNMRALITDYVSEYLSEYEPLAKAKVINTLEAEVNTLIKEARDRINAEKARKINSPIAPISLPLAKVKSSCKLLGVRIDKDGNIDLVQAGKMKRKLARHYHPDLNGGSELHREKYESVLEAYRTLEKYQENR